MFAALLIDRRAIFADNRAQRQLMWEESMTKRNDKRKDDELVGRRNFLKGATLAGAAALATRPAAANTPIAGRKPRYSRTPVPPA